MGVLIDEVFTEVSTPPPNTDGEDFAPNEPTGVQDGEFESSFDQLKHLQKRQLRLIAD